MVYSEADQLPVSRPLIWVGPSRRELKALPREVKRTMGIALWFAQQGKHHPAARPLKGPKLSGVVEIRECYDRRTYRVMYITRLGDEVYVLCAFQKRSTSGIATPKHLLERVTARLQQARAIHAQRRGVL